MGYAYTGAVAGVKVEPECVGKAQEQSDTGYIIPDLEQTQEQQSRYKLLRKWPGHSDASNLKKKKKERNPVPEGKRRGCKTAIRVDTALGRRGWWLEPDPSCGYTRGDQQGVLGPCTLSPAQPLSRVRLFATPCLQHARPPCPSPTPGVHPNPCPLSR